MNLAGTILITDDEKNTRHTLAEILKLEGYSILQAEDGNHALSILSHEKIDLLLLDIKMTGKSGMEVLQTLKNNRFEVPVIMLTGYADVQTALQSIRLGAFDFLEKPFDLNKLLISVRNGIEHSLLLKENRSMREQISGTNDIIGYSREIEQIRLTIKRVAPTDARVLITGENGTGKELVAKGLHSGSKRADKPFVEVNCAAIPTELLESELFGHERGAFTGAIERRVGRIEEANGGTLFLDEIGDMSQSAQAKVLRVLQDNKVTRVGGSQPIEVDVRIIAATNKDLVREIKEGRFREDLYHRLNVIPVHVPPLRERPEDIPILANHFLARLSQKDPLYENKKISQAALNRLQMLQWRGNVRELQNLVERVGILCHGPHIDVDDINNLLDASVKNTNGFGRLAFDGIDSMSFQDFKNESEKMYIQRQLKLNDWNISSTAQKIGVQRSHLYNKIKKYGLTK